MHEFSMTERLIEAVLHEAEKRGAKRVVEVRLSIGKLMFLGLEQVKFAYATLVRGTILEGSKLMIEEEKGIVRCEACGYEGGIQYVDDPAYHISFPTLRCPRCGDIVSIVAGRECMVRGVKLVV